VRAVVAIQNELWILPRPRGDFYVGSFPLHFEKKLWRLLGCPTAVLHPFGGLAEIGDRVDLNATTTPTWVGDAHDLSFIADESYDLVILDPPYSDDEAEWLYGTPRLKPSKFKAEACRVTKPGGAVAVYHRTQPTRPADGWTLTHRIVVLTRSGHAPRVCFVYRKPGQELAARRTSQLSVLA
jgi:hypothetical protein